MSKKFVFPLVAVVSLGLAAGSVGCHAEAKINTENEAKPEPPPPAPPPPPAEPAPEPKIEAKAPVLKAIGKAKIENDEVKIPGKVHFDFEKASIKEDAETKEILKTLVEVMKENPAITKLRIEGHTDDKGATDHNHKLSQARADAIVAYLEKNGVEKTRLETKGWGEEHPIEKNDTKEHQEANRRVEFKVWEIEGKPTEVAKKDGGPSAQGIAASGGVAGGNPEKAGDKKDAKAGADAKKGATPATPATPNGAGNAATPATPATPAKK